MLRLASPVLPTLAPATAAVVAVALAALLDTLVAEPPARVHPVALFGRAVVPLDREWSRPRLVGALVALLTPLLAALTVAVVVRVSSAVPPLDALVAALVLFATTSLRMLLDEARAVLALTERDLPAARERLRSLAGRDASDLSAAEVRSAAVESLAENLADGLVAPLLAFALLGPVSLAAGAGAAAWIKAVNTLDSMLGYRSKPVGWAPARLDDAVMWLPARVSALLFALAAGAPGALGRARRDARTPASPNSGWPMATAAAALSVRLRKPGAYELGHGDLPDGDAGRRALRTTALAGGVTYLLAAAGVSLSGLGVVA